MNIYFRSVVHWGLLLALFALPVNAFASDNLFSIMLFIKRFM
jgi:hypothetical protein